MKNEIYNGLEILLDYFHIDNGNAGEWLERLERNVYKYTDCGAWVNVDFDNATVQFGSIVEGSDAELSCEPIDFDLLTDERISEDIDYLEAETSIEWEKSNVE